MDLPQIVKKRNLSFHWIYRDRSSNPYALVARYDELGFKKKFHQYHLLENDEWAEGAPTPLPIFGVDFLSKVNSDEKVYIFEGEKCAQAAQTMNLLALTSMMGSSRAKDADWAILGGYRHVKQFVLVPDQDEPGKKYMSDVYQEIQKACPNSRVFVCTLPITEKGGDLVDWILRHPSCPPGWNGFDPIDEPYSEYLQSAFEAQVNESLILAEIYFNQAINIPPEFQGDPLPIEEALSTVLPCPTETLPENVVRWIKGLADSMQIPDDFFVSPFLVYVGSLIGRKRALNLRAETEWIEFPNLWGMVIGRPSAMKSPAMEAVKKPFSSLITRATQAYKGNLADYEKEIEGWELQKSARKEKYKSDYKKQLKNGDAKKDAFVQEDPCPSKPKMKRYKTDDPTVEKLGEILIENPQGVLLFRDEISGWLNSFEKTGRENDRQFFLESWSGKQDFNVDRIGRGSIYVPALFLSIFGSIQPGPISSYIRSAIKGGVGDDGFIQRFQMMVWPDFKGEWKLVENPPTKQLEEPIYQIFDHLDKLTFKEENQPVVLQFTADAQAIFDKWQGTHENRLRNGNLPPHLEAHFAKYKKLLPALCLILEHLQEPIEGHYPKQVSTVALEKALVWLTYLESHAWRIYGSGANAVPASAKNLIERVKKREIPIPFTVRDVYYCHHWSGLTNSQEVQEVLDYLAEKNWVAGFMIKTGGCPAMKYWAHPMIFEG